MKANTALKSQARVFLTYAIADRSFANEVSDALTLLGAKVSSFDSLRSGDRYTNAIRQAIGQSDAVVVPLSGVSSKHEIPANVLFEIGAASGAGRMIYVVSRDSSIRLPFGVPGLRILPMNRLDEIIRNSEIVESNEN